MVSRRTLTLVLSTTLAVALMLAALVLPVPYVVLSGGPAFNTTGSTTGQPDGAPVITITGRETFPTDGQLDLTTVSVDRDVTLAEAVLGWFNREEAVAPEEIYFPQDQTEAQQQAESTQQMVQSQSSAKTAALVELGIPVTVAVRSVGPASPASGRLQPGDELVQVDGRDVTSPTVLRDLIAGRSPGADVRLSVRRDGVVRDVALTTVAAPGETPARAYIGIETAVTRYPFEISIALEGVGGPSAGLMFALGVIDKLGPGSLTLGKHVAGTGEITDDGAVGPIGGIQQKMAAARRNKVDVFLVPTDNCADAEANRPDGLQLVRVTTLDSALTALQLIADGGTPRGCAA